MEILLERENQNNHRRVHWSLSGALLLLGCNAMAYRQENRLCASILGNEDSGMGVGSRAISRVLRELR